MYDMLPDEIKMKQNSESVYQKIVQLSRCKFSELQVLCNLEDTELCMTLIYLLHYPVIGKIIPHRLEADSNYFSILSKTFLLMIQQNTMFSIQLTPPDILVESFWRF